jgi:hypothetical protein
MEVRADEFNSEPTTSHDYSNGLLRGLGHVVVDGIGGHIAQAFGGNIDKKCL